MKKIRRTRILVKRKEVLLFGENPGAKRQSEAPSTDRPPEILLPAVKPNDKSFGGKNQMSDQTLDTAHLRSTGMQRLHSGEYPESIARDLLKQGLPPSEVESLFRDAAGKVRSSGLVRVVVGIILLLLTGILVWAMSEAGIKVYGPGLLVGLFVLANGFLKIKNSGEIAGAAPRASR